MTAPERLAKVAEVLARGHFDGNGCGTHGVNACVTCYGPSPMDAHEVAELLAPLLDTFRAEDEARALREAAEEAAERGDIGKPDGPEVWTWLRDRAERIGGGA